MGTFSVSVILRVSTASFASRRSAESWSSVMQYPCAARPASSFWSVSARASTACRPPSTPDRLQPPALAVEDRLPRGLCAAVTGDQVRELLERHIQLAVAVAGRPGISRNARVAEVIENRRPGRLGDQLPAAAFGQFAEKSSMQATSFAAISAVPPARHPKAIPTRRIPPSRVVRPKGGRSAASSPSVIGAVMRLAQRSSSRRG